MAFSLCFASNHDYGQGTLRVYKVILMRHLSAMTQIPRENPPFIGFVWFRAYYKDMKNQKDNWKGIQNESIKTFPAVSDDPKQSLAKMVIAEYQNNAYRIRFLEPRWQHEYRISDALGVRIAPLRMKRIESVS
jgi:hypothetical protein